MFESILILGLVWLLVALVEKGLRLVLLLLSALVRAALLGLESIRIVVLLVLNGLIAMLDAAASGYETKPPPPALAVRLLRAREEYYRDICGGLKRERLRQIEPAKSGASRKWLVIDLKVPILGPVCGLAGWCTGVLIALLYPPLSALHIAPPPWHRRRYHEWLAANGGNRQVYVDSPSASQAKAQ